MFLCNNLPSNPNCFRPLTIQWFPFHLQNESSTKARIEIFGAKLKDRFGACLNVFVVIPTLFGKYSGIRFIHNIHAKLFKLAAHWSFVSRSNNTERDTNKEKFFTTKSFVSQSGVIHHLSSPQLHKIASAGDNWRKVWSKSALRATTSCELRCDLDRENDFVLSLLNYWARKKHLKNSKCHVWLRSNR